MVSMCANPISQFIYSPNKRKRTDEDISRYADSERFCLLVWLNKSNYRVALENPGGYNFQISSLIFRPDCSFLLHVFELSATLGNGKRVQDKEVTIKKEM